MLSMRRCRYLTTRGDVLSVTGCVEGNRTLLSLEIDNHRLLGSWGTEQVYRNRMESLERLRE